MRSLWQVMSDIARNEGVPGLWKGAAPSLLKAAPSAAVTFMACERHCWGAGWRGGVDAWPCLGREQARAPTDTMLVES